MPDFRIVTREFRSIVSRRRKFLVLLGAAFAATSYSLQNVMRGVLPAPFQDSQQYVFALFATGLFILALVMALTLAALHRGMMIFGLRYQACLRYHQMLDPQHQLVAEPANDQAQRFRLNSVSCCFFSLASFVLGFSAILCLFSWGGTRLSQAVSLLSAGTIIGCASGLTTVILFAAYGFIYWQHRGGCREAENKPATTGQRQGPVIARDEWQDHTGASLEDTNHDMIAVIEYVGLITFSVSEMFSGLGEFNGRSPEDTRLVQLYGPLWLSLMSLITCGVGQFAYIRLRYHQGRLSKMIDPTDEPFRISWTSVLRVSFLGYLLLCVFLAISVVFTVFTGWNLICGAQPELAVWLTAGVGACVFAVAFYVASVVRSGKGSARSAFSPAGTSSASSADLDEFFGNGG